MRTIGIVMLGTAMIGAATLSACSTGGDDGPGIAPTGSGTSHTFAADGFTAIDLGGSDDVDVRTGPAFSVRAEGPTDELDRLRIARNGDTLTIGRKRNLLSWGSHPKVKIYVTLPQLREANIAGSGTMMVDRVSGDRFETGIAGSGDLNIAALTANEVEASIAGSGNVRAGGAIKRLEINIAGSGSFDAAGLRADEAEVSIAGSGDVRAAVNGPAQINMLGSGDVDLGPQATCKVSKMGSGSVRCAP